MKFVVTMILSFQLAYTVFCVNEEPHNYDVLRYDLAVDWTEMLNSPSSNPIDKWNGNVKILLTPLVDNLSTIVMDSRLLSINSVSVIINSQPINTYELSNATLSDDLSILLKKAISIGDTMSIDISYTYTQPSQKGFSCVHKNSSKSIHPYAGTLAEPNDSRYWFPCNDRPSDKALINIAVTVPFGMQAASNGNLDSTTIHKENNIPTTETFHWSSNVPLPPYLTTIQASDYVLNIERMPVTSTTYDSIGVYYYTWAEDWQGTKYNAKRSFSTTQLAMNIFSDLFGNYPFNKYGIAVCDFEAFGHIGIGMEHQTLTCVSRSWIISYQTIPEYTEYAHELGHHWFGDYVTCNTWKDAWFNEGGASWLEALYSEKMYGFSDKLLYYNQMKNFRYSYMSAANCANPLYATPVYGLDDDIVFTQQYTPLTYYKSAWIFHQLRELLGDSVCFAMFREMLNFYAYSNITAEQFINFVVNYVPNPPLGIDINKFVRQWIYDAGHPWYSVNTIVNKNENCTYETITKLCQRQGFSKVPPIFEMFVDINFFKDSQLVYTKRVLNNKKEQLYSFTFDKSIDSVSLDTRTSLLEILSMSTVSAIEDISYNTSFTIFPNVVKQGDIINIISDISLEEIELTDMLGNTVKICINNATIPTANIPIGSYFVLKNDECIGRIIITK